MLDNIEYMRDSLKKLAAMQDDLFRTKECQNSERCVWCIYRTFCRYLDDTLKEGAFTLKELKNTTIQ